MKQLAFLDWLVIGGYCFGLLVFAAWLAKGQGNREDYYVGGRSVGAWPVGLSIMATQCSTNSILGAPAFVAFAAGGGLVWLQYELAVPLAMIVLMLWLLPVFRQLQLVSVYAYLEQRFDRKTRLSLSGLFLFVRAFATAVTVYSIAIVVDLITGLGFTAAVLLLGVFTIVYDVMGGIRGVIYSDVIQLFILVGMLVLVLVFLIDANGGFTQMWQAFDSNRKATLRFDRHGFGDGGTFAFWPMLFGGLFLYVSYYGCDQSQVQRQLSTNSIDTTNRALFLNGILRFPLVMLYCMVGVGIGVYAMNYPAFLNALPSNGGSPEYNLAVPVYMVNALPVGLVGLSLVALFAAAMSSLDSVLNSLSATTLEDFVRPFRHKQLGARQELWLSRAITSIWGAITLGLAFFVGDIAPTVLEAINKIGSLANGPILAVFLLGILTTKVSGTHAVAGLLAGVIVNAMCWFFWPSISWLWWNVIGCGVALLLAIVLRYLPFVAPALGNENTIGDKALVRNLLNQQSTINWYRRSAYLVGWFLLLWLILVFIQFA